MARVEDCEQALHHLAEALRGPHGDRARRAMADRTVSCRLTDLDVTFSGTLRDGGLHGIARVAEPDAQIRLTMTSDDLLALADGSLNLMSAWASRRISIGASMGDLLRLRKLF